MIQPKFHEAPADSVDELETAPDGESEEQRTERQRKPRAGLSINDTIAGGAGMSVGSRGVDTSGVSTGAGAGAGMTKVTAGEAGETPAASIVPGSRSSGTTPRGQYGSDQIPTVQLDAESDLRNDDEIAARAYRCWHERGCPHGSPEDDWHRAEREIREEREHSRSRSASA